ncbi:MAG: SRPBCC family protein [Bacteroidia bacterium]|nr:SRPBCC family protein [Bacteroidia bacterium]
MKFLKYLLYLIVIVAIVFVAFGLLMPTVDYGYEIKVDKPIEEAWAVSQDQELYAEWLEGFKSMELIEGEQDAIGSKYKIVVNPGEGQPDFEMVETLVAIEEHKFVEMHFDSEMMDFDQKILFSEEDGQTTIRTESTVTAKGLVMRSFFGMMETFGGAFTKQEGKNMEALKKLIEGNMKDYNPAPEPVVLDSLSVGS